MLSRRELIKSLIAAGGLALVPSAWAKETRYGGVRIGVQSASFTYSGMGIDGIIKTMSDVGLGEIDCMSEHVENYLGAPVPLPGAGRPGPWAQRTTPAPPAGSRGRGRGPGRGFAFGMDPAKREALRKWRLEVDLDKFRHVGKLFTDAGLTFFSYNLSFNDAFTDEEIEKGFQMTKALGTRIITASSPVSIFPRLAPFAEKHDVIVAMHNHINGPEEFAEAMKASKNIWVNLDVGHFFASGYDPIAYIEEHHDRITNLHIKDRKKNNGPSVPFGQGDTPLKQILLLLRDRKYDLLCCIEDVAEIGPAADLKQCLDYCKGVLS
jgi:sugar phosphate isomerase/epimerase